MAMTDRPTGPATLRAALEPIVRRLEKNDLVRRPLTSDYPSRAMLRSDVKALRAALAAPSLSPQPTRESAADGLDEEHCCNDPTHMSAEYLALLREPSREPGEEG